MRHFPKPAETEAEKIKRLEQEVETLERQVQELTRARDIPLPKPTDWPDSHRPPAMPNSPIF